MGFLAVFVCYIDRVNISVAAIAMQDQFGWSDTTKGVVLSSFFIGYILTLAAAGWAANRFGTKRVLGFAVVWWSLFTIITPLAAYASFPLLIAARIALGLGEAATFPAGYGILSKWFPPVERSRAIALLMSGIPIGTLFALMTTGWIVTNYGWPAAFYGFGMLGFVWAAAWYLLIHESPAEHPGISDAERQLIAAGAPQTVERKPVPWGQFIRLGAFWALIVNHFCSNWVLYIFLAWLPSYFRDVQGLSISGAGIYSAAPWLTMFLMTNVSAWIADTMLKKGISTTAVRKIMQSIGLLGTAVFLLLVRDVSSATVAVVYMSAALGLAAFTIPGFGTNHLDIAPKYADVLVGITNTFGTIPGIVGVALTGWIVDRTGSFDSVFVVVAVTNIIGTIVWLTFSSGRKLVD
ncbi:MAG: ACS family MFS transporter [Gammaproteobacteria bacterium]|nr:ACS family MFS transporter [Gammaproteobacteria bacterium]